MKLNSRRHGRVTLIALALAAALTRQAEANMIPAFELNVTYTDGAIVSEPLSFGLAALPDSVDASFLLTQGQVGSEPPITEFFASDVISADISFGDGTWTVNQLSNFFMQTINGVVTELVYDFNPITTLTVVDGPILNFPLTITGTDIATDETFEYFYASSTQSLTPVSAIPEPTTLTLWSLGAVALVGLSRRRPKRSA